MSKTRTVQGVPNDFSGSKSNQITNRTIAGIVEEKTFASNETTKKDLASENEEILMSKSKRNPLKSKQVALKSNKPLKTKTEKSFTCKICPVKFQHKHEAAPNKTIEKDAIIMESQITEIVEERIIDINETTKSKKSKNEEDIILACKFCEKPFNDAGTLKFHETCHAHNDATPYSCKVESVQDWSFSVLTSYSI